MRARYKWPGGTGIIALEDTATLGDLVRELQSKTLLSSFGIKIGPPIAMKTVDMNETDQLVRSLGLHGETLTIVPNDSALASASATALTPTAGNDDPRQPAFSQRKATEPQDVNVPWGEREGTLILRVMPSDNSCLFTAFGGALPQQIAPLQLRKMMADYIRQHLDVYSEAILGISPERYCQSIVDPDRWGGGIELSILSSIFDIKICTYDVQTQNLISFGEGKRDQCILVYSGIHYDRIAFSYSEQPYNEPTLPPDMDRTTWPVDDQKIHGMAKDLVQKLHDAHYFTDIDGLVLKCDVAGCGWIGSGQIEGQKHAEVTGHTDLSEVQDTEAEAILRRCNIPGCDFMGQGDKSTRQHSQDTGHESYSVIEDW